MIRIALALTALSVAIAWWQKRAAIVPRNISPEAEAQAQRTVDTLQYWKQGTFYAAAGVWCAVLIHAATWSAP